MHFLKKTSAWLFIGLLLVLFGWVIFSPKENFAEKVKATLKKQKNQADIIFIGATFSETFGGVKYWELEAKTSTLNNDQGFAQLLGVTGRFYQANRPVLKFIAPTVFWNLTNKRIKIKEPFGYDKGAEKSLTYLKKIISTHPSPRALFNVAANFSGKINGTWFKANQINWKLKTKNLSGNSGVVLNNGTATIFAKNLYGNANLSALTLTGKPVALIIMPRSAKNKTTKITAQKFTVNAKFNEISAINNVQITAGNTLIKANRADYLDKTRQITFTGKVKLYHKEITASCDQATYSLAKNIITLVKKGFAKRGENKIYGDKIIIDLANIKISVAGKTKIVVNEDELK